MEKEYVILSAARLGLLLFSFFALSRSVLTIKIAWQENNQKRMSRGVSLLWSGVIAGCMFLKLFDGV